MGLLGRALSVFLAKHCERDGAIPLRAGPLEDALGARIGATPYDRRVLQRLLPDLVSAGVLACEGDNQVHTQFALWQSRTREPWRRLYVREEGPFASLPVATRAVAAYLACKAADDEGMLRGLRRPEEVSVYLLRRGGGGSRQDQRLTLAAVTGLRDEGFLVADDRGMRVKNFAAAQLVRVTVATLPSTDPRAPTTIGSLADAARTDPELAPSSPRARPESTLSSPPTRPQLAPNDKLLAIVDTNTSAKSAFAMCDEILRQAVEGVSDIITTPGDINTDFNDIKAIMEGAGPALMGIGIAEGDDRSTAAAKQAVNSPLLDVSIGGAKGILFVVASNDDLGIMEVQEAAKVINESVDKNAKIIFGMMKDDKLKKGQIRIIVIATGFPESLIHTSHTGPERSLFAMPVERREEERGRIYHEILKREAPEQALIKPEIKKEEPLITRIEKEEPIVTATPHQREEAPVPEDDEAWGAIPSFLRRHKK
jgi:hypothetical protein